VGGVVPTVGDIAVAANGHVITIDVNTTCDAIESINTSGYFLLPNGITLTADVKGGATPANNATLKFAANATCTINGNIEYSPGLITDGQVLRIDASGVNLTINGNCFHTSLARSTLIDVVSGGDNAVINITGNVTATTFTGTSQPSVRIAASGVSINVVGNVSGGTGISSAVAISSTQNTAIQITGNVSGFVANAINLTNSSATVIVTGTVTGGSNTNIYGISTTGESATINVTGNVTGGGGLGAYGINSTGANSLVSVVGTATAVSTYNNAISSTATTNGVVFSGNMISSNQGALPVRANVFRLLDTNLSGITQYADDTFPTGSLVTRVSADLVQGMPSASDVRFETLYGVDNTLTGTLHMPNSGSVAFGVSVDNTVGVLASNAAEIADEIVNRLLAVTEENNIVTVPYSTGSVNYTRTKVLDSTRTVQLTEI
jgi:hypothetical protein